VSASCFGTKKHIIREEKMQKGEEVILIKDYEGTEIMDKSFIINTAIFH